MYMYTIVTLISEVNYIISPIRTTKSGSIKRHELYPKFTVFILPAMKRSIEIKVFFFSGGTKQRKTDSRLKTITRCY